MPEEKQPAPGHEHDQGAPQPKRADERHRDGHRGVPGRPDAPGPGLPREHIGRDEPPSR